MRYTVSTFVLTKIVWSSGATMTSNGSPITGITSTCVSRPTSTRPTLSLNWFATYAVLRSEEHTSELQSQSNLVCRLLLEKKKKKQYILHNHRHVSHMHTHTD